ncbi:MAG: cysteine--tRNA ligase [Aestuariivirga sp.]
MPLRLYNTLTRQKEDFVPLDRKNVRMYACGPTVYDYAHIGNARPVIVFDVLFRLLRHLYGPDHVTYVRNITDIDDKINARAKEEGTSIGELTERTTKLFHDDIAALGVLPPTVEPRATDNISQMIGMIATLIAKGHAYEAGGEVLFEISTMPDYGKLSNRSLEDQQAGARVAVEAHKRNPGDFVLWKLSEADEPGWESPWGRGRPGWHIECSAMSKRYLDKIFDIHAGGLDLIFPHHENEIAQSRCAHGTAVMANVWMHNGFLQVEGQKMSKSLGNFVTIRDLLRGWRGEPWSGSAIRFEMLGTHYRQPIDWTVDRLTSAKANIQMLASNTAERNFANVATFEIAWKGDPTPSEELLSALSDDLNTPDALSYIKESISKILTLNDKARINLVHDTRFLGLTSSAQRPFLTGSIGLSQMAESLVDSASINFRDWRTFSANNDAQMVQDREKWFESNKIRVESPNRIIYFGSDPTRGKIEKLVEARNEARKTRNWVEGDRIRDELAAMSIVIKDNKDGTTDWEVRR